MLHTHGKVLTVRNHFLEIFYLKQKIYNNFRFLPLSVQHNLGFCTLIIFGFTILLLDCNLKPTQQFNVTMTLEQVGTDLQNLIYL